jgi:predicted PurR-regulated permease PerM
MIATSDNRYTIAAWVISAGLLYLVLHLHLVAALLAGLLVYELVHVIAPRLPLIRSAGSKLAAIAILATLIVVALVGVMLALGAFLQSEAGSLPNLLQKLADVIETARAKLPQWVGASVPSDADALKVAIGDWLHAHSADLRLYGGELGHAVAHMLIGMVIGAMVSLQEARPHAAGGPLAQALLERAARLGEAFRRVVFAQVRISALNTFFTAIYLLAILPMFGVHLPYRKTLVAVTFLTGLLPVIGNLISNTLIVLVSLGVSVEVALASLAFLVVIHKLEYFLNARIVGSRIHARPWELLVAMLLMEAAFGLPGLAAAPIYYAYLKDELAARGLI